eukprot:2368078-Prymnesium_polylepis.1
MTHERGKKCHVPEPNVIAPRRGLGKSPSNTLRTTQVRESAHNDDDDRLGPHERMRRQTHSTVQRARGV